MRLVFFIFLISQLLNFVGVFAGKAKEDLQQRAELKSEVEKSLATIEREVTNKIEQLALRVSVFEALKHLIVAGNVLTYLPKKGSMRVFPLTQYVCQRDS